MKKICLMVILTLLVYGQLFSQTRPIMGYDQVAWGVSADEVRRVYNLGDNIQLTPHQDDPARASVLEQEDVSDSIGRRTFMFIDGRLYRVVVRYRDTSDATRQNLDNLLVNRFGRQTDYDIQTGTTTLMFQSVNYRTETRTYGTYSPELVVELVHHIIFAGIERDTMNLLGQNQLFVRYTWKTFRDEYQASRLGL